MRTDHSGKDEELRLDGIATDVRDGRVTVEVNSAPVRATVQWDPTIGRYRFESSTLRSLDFREQTGRELTAAINGDQRMRIVPYTEGSVYVNGQFIAVPDPHTSRAGLRLLNVMTGMENSPTSNVRRAPP